jgi:hypothetical protein
MGRRPFSNPSLPDGIVERAYAPAAFRKAARTAAKDLHTWQSLCLRLDTDALMDLLTRSWVTMVREDAEYAARRMRGAKRAAARVPVIERQIIELTQRWRRGLIDDEDFEARRHKLVKKWQTAKQTSESVLDQAPIKIGGRVRVPHRPSFRRTQAIASKRIRSEDRLSLENPVRASGLTKLLRALWRVVGTRIQEDKLRTPRIARHVYALATSWLGPIATHGLTVDGVRIRCKITEDEMNHEVRLAQKPNLPILASASGCIDPQRREHGNTRFRPHKPGRPRGRDLPASSPSSRS